MLEFCELEGGSEGSGEPGIAEDEYEYKLSKCFEGIEDKRYESNKLNQCK